MRRLISAAALVAVALAVAPGFALADDSDQQPAPDNGLNPGFDTSATSFDLGIDVTDVPHNPAAVRSFILGLSPETQSAVMGACETFMEHPGTVQSQETYAFCSNAVRG